MTERMAGHVASDALFGGALCVAAWLLVTLAAGSTLSFLCDGAGMLGTVIGGAVAIAVAHRSRESLCGPRRAAIPTSLAADGWPSIALAVTLALRGLAGGDVPDVLKVTVQALAAAVGEELVFRRALLAELAPLGPTAACVGSTAVFAAAHALGVPAALVPLRVAEAFGFGLFLSSEVWGGISLPRAMGFHLAFDLALGLATGPAVPAWALLLTGLVVAVQLGVAGGLRLVELRQGR
ncbi:CPBP family intramembrane glutamic endopeptidase [Tractidigestivibacter scatoligenes]|uniref:CPBP family intramembrane glutamic endopeptidase n=1 Tax=Tractidigestivibacter scatoligenes TaxID=1299998 RepID=UPI002F360E51